VEKLFDKLANISTRCLPWGLTRASIVQTSASLLINCLQRIFVASFEIKVATHSAKMGLRVLREIWHCWRQNWERSLNAINLPFSVWTFQKKNVANITHKLKDTWHIALSPTYLYLWLHLCFLGVEPHRYSYIDTCLQHRLEGATSRWKSLGERPKGVQLMQSPAGALVYVQIKITSNGVRNI
jgi:hypothetical protein